MPEIRSSESSQVPLNKKVIAIHQPNFFPWLGYFRKIMVSDVFVFLDRVQFPKTSRGTWLNRSHLAIGGKAAWITCPYVHPKGKVPMDEVLIDDAQPWRKKLTRTIAQNYSKARFFEKVFPWVETMVNLPAAIMAEYNMRNIIAISEYLGLDTPLKRHADLVSPEVVEASGSRRLAAICRELGGDVYLSGDGADSYEDIAAYTEAGVVLRKSNFQIYPYPQCHKGEFLRGLSILDALFNLPPDEICDLLTKTQENVS